MITCTTWSKAHEGAWVNAVEDAGAFVALWPLKRPELAPFLAQLIATKMQAPQTRARRRAEPTEAIAAYSTAMAPRPCPYQVAEILQPGSLYRPEIYTPSC